MQVQVEILKRFKAGELNALVATAVAEEGLDITHCSLIVRWTLPATTRQFIQSRGRARAPGSSMVRCSPACNICCQMMFESVWKGLAGSQGSMHSMPIV